jgi:hypothetical protein
MQTMKVFTPSPLALTDLSMGKKNFHACTEMSPSLSPSLGVNLAYAKEWKDGNRSQEKRLLKGTVA